jgi:hypothetical protein
MSVFAKYQAEMFPYRFIGQLHVGCIAGGTPTDPNVAEGWLKTKLGVDKDDLIREMVAQTMVERGVTADEAAKLVDTQKHLNGFKRDEHGLYIEGRQLKAALKEAASVAVAAGKLTSRGWGKTNKGLLSYLAEHVFVVEDRLHLGVAEATGINQRFVHTFRGSGIQYEEYVEGAKVDFTVICDHEFSEREWAAIWTSGEQQGIGASRSQGYGRYEVTRWDAVDAAADNAA